MAKVADLVAPIKKAHGLHYKNPRFPLNVKLPHKLELGTKVYIHGAIYATAARFAVNLKNAEVDAHNFFHFNPRFDESCVVRNSRLDESWGDEERDGDFPFIAGEPFLITITPTEEHFEVEVNGAPFITFNYREGMSFTDVSYISMWGDVTIYGIHIPAPPMIVPLSLRIPTRSFMGDTYLIEGHVPDGADRFHVNIQCGEQEDADILYHFNPRIADNILVCNNRCADAWGSEERSEGLPAAGGDHFTLFIVAAKEGYIPFLNGNRMPTFEHRQDLCGACVLNIGGDVQVENLTIDCPPVRMPPTVPDIDVDSFEEITTQSLHSHAPVTLALPGSFAPSKMIYISAKVDDSPSRFAVNLQCGETLDDEIALHVNPRWDDDQGSVLIFNSRDADSWGEEIRVPNPVAPGEEVDIFIIGTEIGYSVIFNGEVVQDIEHRIDISRVTHVNIDGCITLYRMLGN